MELDGDLLATQAIARENAADLRSRALAVDAEPDRMEPHVGSPGLQAIQKVAQPGMRCLETTVALIELARGDAGLVLACPGPALAGVIVAVLGTAAQQEQLAAAVANGSSWAFFAVTEPHAGSDVARMRTELRPDGCGGYLLHGAKRYIGNGSRASAGVVFARTGPGPLSLRAALIEVPAANLRAEPLDMIGLRGARISHLSFDGVQVPASALLGAHLPPVRRGMWGAIQAFNRVRVQVAAMAAGTALAVYDYVRAERTRPGADDAAILDATGIRIETVRRLIYRAAVDIDAGPRRGYLASIAKLEAVSLAVEVCGRLPALLGRGALLEHPLLEKWWRDCAAFEFMEGTSTIQRLNVAQGYLKGQETYG
ncbi:MAG: acyl-CoA dehydrogenase [Streptosporangiaceae bacterium]|nr:acyl-CoA dehydrogenase [Streptosporangiaceae bacterium]